MTVNSTPPTGGTPSPKTFLIGSVETFTHQVKCCPTASTLLCTELESGLDCIVAIPCKRWGCKWCGQRRAFTLGIRCEAAKPERFITLTIDPKRWATPRDAYDGTRRKVADFGKVLRKELGTFDYIRILEVTKAGWPHYHFLARCPFIRQDRLSVIWAGMTGAPIVDIRRIDKGMNVFKYVLKYLCKQTYVPWTNRRVSWSRDFFPKPEAKERKQSPFINKTRLTDHPAQTMAKKYAGHTVVERHPGVWVIATSDERTKQRVPYSN